MDHGSGIESAGSLSGLERLLNGDAVYAVCFGDNGGSESLDEDSVDGRLATPFEYSRTALGDRSTQPISPRDVILVLNSILPRSSSQSHQ
jgi:hypothetical protein